MKRLIFALVVVVLSVPSLFAYTKPNTYRASRPVCANPLDPSTCVLIPEAIVFKEQIPFSPHSWVIPKAIDLLRTDGFGIEADLAQMYLLPMEEGVTFNDVWGDADMAGGSVLDYYDPDSSTDFGYGCVLDGFVFAPYKNCTNTYTIQQNGNFFTVVGFATHPLYGYQNAAEHAQFRYDYGKRIYLGNWGTDPRDLMAGWVIDTVGGQDDPFDGRWASGATGIDNATAPDGTQSRFGSGKRPVDALQDLFDNHTNIEILFPNQSDDTFSTLHVPTEEVFSHAPEWFDDHFGSADDVEAYMGWDGHDTAWYANWTLDASGHCNGGDGCAAPMVVRFPVSSRAHAFFQLGWAIHLLEDNTTPVHTVNGSIEAFERHNDIETMADAVLRSNNPVAVNAGVVENLLPALNTSDFVKLYDFPPTPNDVILPGGLVVHCPSLYPTNPSFNFNTRWYTDTLARMSGEGVAHAYTRNLAEISHRFIPYIECINTESDHNWPAMGFFTALALDNAIKATAGLIRQFIEDTDKTAPTATITQPAATTYPHSGTLTLDYSSPTDDESGVKSVTVTLDGKTTVGGHGLASGQAINLLTEIPILGNHTLTITATDNAGNVASPSVTFSIVVTAASIMDDVRYYLSTGDITINNEANSLLQKLKAGAAYRQAGDCKNANQVYASFISELLSQSGKRVSKASAAIMIADAQYLMAHCP